MKFLYILILVTGLLHAMTEREFQLREAEQSYINTVKTLEEQRQELDNRLNQTPSQKAVIDYKNGRIDETELKNIQKYQEHIKKKENRLREKEIEEDEKKWAEEDNNFLNNIKSFF